MELKLRDDNEEVKETPTKILDVETGDIVGKDDFSDLESQPVKISTNIDYKSPYEKKKGVDVFSIVKWIVIAVIVFVAVKFIINLANPKVTDLTPYINVEAEELSKKLDLDFKDDADMASKVNQYSRGEITVKGDGDVGVVYIDGQYAGLHTDSKSYSMFNLQVGDPEYSMEDDMSFESDESMCVLNDLAGGSSTAYFYARSGGNDCFVIIVNEHSNRIAAMTYFNDYMKVTETLESIE